MAYYHRIRIGEVKEALKRMDNGKDVSPNDFSVSLEVCRRRKYHLTHIEFGLERYKKPLRGQIMVKMLVQMK